MKGEIPVSAGSFKVTPEVWFDFRRLDDGTVVSLCDLRVNRRYTVLIDNGAVVQGEVGRLIRDEPDPAPFAGEKLPEITWPPPSAGSPTKPAPRSVPPPPKNVSGPTDGSPPRRSRGRLTPRKATRTKFTIQYGETYSPRNRCFVISGYANAEATLVLYRIMPNTDGIARLVPPYHVIIHTKEDPDRIPDVDWEKFMNMAAGKTFPLNGKAWTKLSNESLEALVDGKVFKKLRRSDDELQSGK